MPRQTRPVILLEFSQLTSALVHELPNFRRFHAESRVYVTDGDAAAWETVHTGLPIAEHGIHQKCMWDVVSDHGLRVWVCGSPHTRYQLPLNGCVVPDPATSAIAPHPLELLPSPRATWDLFQSYYRRIRPHLATFFVDDSQKLDALLGRFLRLAAADATLVLLSPAGEQQGGFCWIRTADRTHAVATDRVSLRALAPTVLRLLGVPIPGRMTAAPLLGERARESGPSPRHGAALV